MFNPSNEPDPHAVVPRAPLHVRKVSQVPGAAPRQPGSGPHDPAVPTAPIPVAGQVPAGVATKAPVMAPDTSGEPTGKPAKKKG